MFLIGRLSTSVQGVQCLHNNQPAWPELTKGGFVMNKRICCKELSMEFGKRGCFAEDSGEITLYERLYGQKQPCKLPSVLRDVDRDVLGALEDIHKILHGFLRTTKIPRKEIPGLYRRFIDLDERLNDIRQS